MSRDRERPVPAASITPSRDPTAEVRPLEGPLRSKMEARFGEDFSAVRVHSGEAADESARALGARAYAVGDDVALGPGHTLDTPRGEALLEHELGHVVEQRHGAPLGLYRAPEGEAEARAEESQPLLGRTPSYRLDPKLGSLSLGLSTIDGFDFNKSTVKDEQASKIADVVDKLTMLLGRMPTGRISVTGYTDLVGGEASNVRLGLRRAEAVRQALVKGGVPNSVIRVASEGKHAPLVPTAKPEPRNRRVEVRFEGELITPGTGPLLRAPEPPPRFGERRKVELFPETLPSTGPPVTQKPTPSPPQQAKPEPKGTEGPPKKGSAGDVIDAITKIPDVARLIENAKEGGTRDLGKLSTGEKIAVGTVAVPLATGALAGIWSDPTGRKALLDLADGKEIPVPGVPWLKIVPKTAGGAAGGMLKIDILKIVSGSK